MMRWKHFAWTLGIGLLTGSLVTGVAISQKLSPGIGTAGGQSCRTPDRSEVRIPGATFRMGSAEFYEEEGPVHPVTVKSFSIDRFAVTNAEFAKFVKATGYITDAERPPKPEDYPEVEPDKLVAGGAVFTPPGELAPSQWPRRQHRRQGRLSSRPGQL
jgi:formylglycine-generating enzyme required for sulfatase activity